MDDIEFYVTDHIQPMVERGEVVKIHVVAGQIQKFFPRYSHGYVAQFALAAVVKLKGNAVLGDHFAVDEIN